MKVRILSFTPQNRELKAGQVYDLADAEHFLANGEAEPVDAAAEALADPRPQPEPAPAEAAPSEAADGEVAPADDAAKSAKAKA